MKTTEDVLSELVAYEYGAERKPDEFDADDYVSVLAKRGVRITREAAYNRLRRRESRGWFTSRIIRGEKNGAVRVFKTTHKLPIDVSKST